MTSPIQETLPIMAQPWPSRAGLDIFWLATSITTRQTASTPKVIFAKGTQATYDLLMPSTTNTMAYLASVADTV